jgi:fibronectin-binding autotransporter adhesin
VLTDTVSTYGATITVTAGTLVNASGATITALQGAGGARNLNVELDNQGTLTVSGSQLLTINRTSADHQNNTVGTIDVSGGDLTIVQSGTTPTFANFGTITIGAGRTFTVSGGTLSQSAGTIGGAGTLALSSTTASFNTNFTNATTGLTMVSSTFNGPGTLTNATGKSLTLVSSTIGAAVTNQGILTGTGNSSIPGTLTSVAGSTLRVQGNNTQGAGTLTIGQGFTNNGAIELTDSVSTYGATLVVPNSSVTNASGGTITALPGAGGQRTLDMNLTNAGTITVSGSQGLTITKLSATYTNTGTIDVTGGNLTFNLTSGSNPTLANSGTITVGSGRTLTVSGGTLNQTAGSIGGSGTLSLTGTTANFTTSFSNATTGLTIYQTSFNGPGTLTNATAKTLTITGSTINAPFVNQGTLVTNGFSVIGGSLTTAAGDTIRVEGSNTAGQANLSVTNGFTNNGAIVLTDIVSTYGAILGVTNGTLTNAVGGTIAALPGAGGLRQLNAQLDNQGTLTVSASQGMSINRNSSAHTNSGSISLAGGNLTVNQGGTTPSITTTGAITLASGRTLTVSGGAINLNAGAIVGGTLALSSTTANLAISLSNATVAVTLTNSTVNGPGTFTNASGQLLTMASSTINAPFVNQGFLNSAGTSAINGSLTTVAGDTIRLQGNGNYGQSGLTVSSGFTNNGAILLTDSTSTYGAVLTVASGTLTNSSTGTINAQPGSGGLRTLTAEVANAGTLTVSGAQGLTLSKASAAHTNSGTIDVSGGSLTVVNSGVTGSLTNTGTLTIGASRTLTINNGGSFTQSGTIGGTGTLALAAVNSATFNNSFTNAITGLTLQATTVNGPGTITNAAGKTLTMTGGTMNAPFVNTGTLVTQGTATIAGTFQTDTSSVVRVKGNSTQGAATLTVSNSFFNNGDIELTDSVSTYGATLSLGGTLTSQSGSTISSLAGAGGTRTINGNVTTQFGTTMTVKPGGAGKLTINGSLSLGGTLNLEVGGLTQSTQYDLLEITGTLTPGGSSILNVTTFGGFTGSSGNSFTMITYASVISGFEIVNRPSGWNYVQGATSFVLSVP